MSLDVDSAFELMERSVKRLSITIVDDFEEIKRGTPRPIIALLRKLLFYTSTLIMKQMLLRGCPSQVSDKKVVIATFDLLREQMKFSPGITIDQFLSQTYVSHKMQVITKLAEHIAATDRSVTKTPSKVNFIVPHVDYNHSPHNKDTNTFEPNMYDQAPESPGSLLSPMFGSSSSRSPTPTKQQTQLRKSGSRDGRDEDGVNQEVLSKSAWPMTDFIKLHMAEKLHAKGLSAQGITPKKAATPKSRSTSPNSLRSSATSNHNTTPSLSRSGSAPRLSRTASKSADSPQSPQNALSSSARFTPRNKRLDLSEIQLSAIDASITPRANTPTMLPKEVATVPAVTAITSNNSIDNNSIVGEEKMQENVFSISEAQLSQMVDARVEAAVQQRVEAAMKAMLEKNEAIMSKIVGAVDAEFTLMSNRLRVLEAAVAASMPALDAKPSTDR